MEAIGLVKGVLHPTWLANPVVVRKASGKWRLCTIFTDVNKACPKDPFPLSRIDQIVDSTAGCNLLSFLNAYSGYHQIFMAEEDEEKTAFITHLRHVLLQVHAFWTEECGLNVCEGRPN